MLVKPDHTLIKAKQYVKDMPESLEKFHVDYVIKNLEDRLNEKEQKLQEYREFFKTLGKLLPNSGPAIFGGIKR